MKKKINVRLVISSICLILFLLLLFLVVNDKTVNFDRRVYEIFVFNKLTTTVMKTVTFFGEWSSLLLISIFSVLILKNKIFALSIPLNMSIIALFNFTVKNIVCRPRPDELRLIEESGYSFPSGHSAVSLAFYGYIIYLIFKYCKNKFLKTILIGFLTMMILSIGMSRIYLGVHYVTDVIGGYCFSLAYLVWYTYLIDRGLELHFIEVSKK
ncbi:MAG: phosphatase PAP2 family protein [Bacilli bacterium]|nr:phosphatase PAP2 family protein [Bacilli bacterium]